MAPDVKCSVDNCVHWSDMKCSASEVEVSSNGGMQEICSSDDTCCGTFATRQC